MLLLRTTLSILVAQVMVIAVLAAAVPGAASTLTLWGFVTPFYADNLFAVHIAPLPWTAPTVYISVQTAAQMLMVALTVAAVVGFFKANSWQHGAAPTPAPAPRERPVADPEPSYTTGGEATAAQPQAPRPPSGPPAGPAL